MILSSIPFVDNGEDSEIAGTLILSERIAGTILPVYEMCPVSNAHQTAFLLLRTPIPSFNEQLVLWNVPFLVAGAFVAEAKNLRGKKLFFSFQKALTYSQHVSCWECVGRSSVAKMSRKTRKLPTDSCLNQHLKNWSKRWIPRQSLILQMVKSAFLSRSSFSLIMI